MVRRDTPQQRRKFALRKPALDSYSRYHCLRGQHISLSSPCLYFFDGVQHFQPDIPLDLATV